MEWLRRRPAQIGVAALLLAYLVFRLTRLTEVPALLISEQKYKPLLQISGEVIPAQESQLSSALAGQVAQIPVNEGQKVAWGDLLVALDDASVRLEVEQAANELRTAQLNLQQGKSLDYQEARRKLVEDQESLAQTERNLKRVNSLAEAGAASAQEVENAQHDLAAAREQAASSSLLMESYSAGGSNLGLLETQVYQKSLALKLAQLKLDNCCLRAPFAGIVLEIQINAGERIVSGQKLVRLGAATAREVEIKPDQQYKDMLQIGMKARVWLPQDPNAVWFGRVSQVSPAADPALGTLGARISIDGNNTALKPGSLVTVQLSAIQPVAGVLLSEQWLVVVDGKTGAWVLKEGQAHFRSLTLGARGAWGVVVKQGLNKGDTILLPGQLEEGKRVKPYYNAGGSQS